MRNRINVIYGAGMYGQKLAELFEISGTPIHYFCQTNIGERKQLKGIPVISIEELNELSDDCVIYIAVYDRDVVQEIKTLIAHTDISVVKVFDCCEFMKHHEHKERLYKVVYNGMEFEKKAYRNSWLPYLTNQEKIEAASQKVCKNLSKNDTLLVNKIISRMKKLLEDNIDPQTLFSFEENKQIIQMKFEFYNKIEESISGGKKIYSWKGYKLFDRNFDYSVFYYQCGMPYVSNIDKVRDGCVIDAGAYIGDSAIVLAEYTKEKVYAFEAWASNCSQIAQIAKLNGKTNIVPVNKAIGEKSGINEMYIRKEGTTGHGLVKRDGLEYIESESVETVSLDEFVSREKIKNISLIKTDIEGAEQALIKGALRTINEFKPVLLISMYHTAEDFFNIKEMIEQMNLGYSFRIFHPVSANNILTETVLVCEVL